MGWWRLGVVVVLAWGGCGSGNSGGEGTVVVSHGEGGSAMDGAARDARGVPEDARLAEAGPPEAGIDAAPAATWTAIYQNLLVNPSNPSNCMGASCHDPGTEKKIDLSTSEKGYTTISPRLVPGSPDSSELVTVLQSGYMPAGRPRMSAQNIDLIRAWIRAGALDD